jgi:hypothetical protein
MLAKRQASMLGSDPPHLQEKIRFSWDGKVSESWIYNSMV